MSWLPVKWYIVYSALYCVKLNVHHLQPANTFHYMVILFMQRHHAYVTHICCGTFSFNKVILTIKNPYIIIYVFCITSVLNEVGTTPRARGRGPIRGNRCIFDSKSYSFETNAWIVTIFGPNITGTRWSYFI